MPVAPVRPRNIDLGSSCYVVYRAARRRLEPVLAHFARAIILAHRAPLISTMPHGAPRLAEIATVDTTRSHAGAPVRDGLRLINA
jgi:hypothetical protein